MVILSLHLQERWTREARLAAGWWEGLGGGLGSPHSCRLWCLESRWKAARELQIHSPHNWLFSCIAERHSLAAADSHCFLLQLWGVGAKEMWGREAALGAPEVRSHLVWEAYCSGILKLPVSRPVWDGAWYEIKPDKRECLLNGWRRDKYRCFGQWKFCGFNDFLKSFVGQLL